MPVEARGEVAADCVSGQFFPVRAEPVGEELEVLFEVLLRPSYANELDEAVGGVAGEPGSLGDRDDAVWVGGEGLVLTRVKAQVAAVSVDQSRLIEAVAAHRATDGVGEQPFDVFFAVRAVEGDLVVENLGSEFVS